MRVSHEDGGDVQETQNMETEKVLMSFFSGCLSNSDDMSRQVSMRCVQLFQQDHECAIISNSDSRLCAHYPLDLIVPTADHNADSGIGNTDADASLIPQLSMMMEKAKFARTRSRFVVPVIRHRGKNICRSATLSRQIEIHAREAWEVLSGAANFSVSDTGTTGVGEHSPDSKTLTTDENTRDEATAHIEASDKTTDDADRQKKERHNSAETSYNAGCVTWHRGKDIALLNRLGVRYICDLMVEDKKIKYGLTLTSSEKVDKLGRYKADFDIAAMPYPGCEAFRAFQEQHYCAARMHYNWNGAEVTTSLNIPEEHRDGCSWSDYKAWNFVDLTQNYFLLLLRFLHTDNDAKDKGGLLIHCISGWDRTPLFISLLRMSLWADGEIHESLTASEMLYLTLSYDWVLFGHCLTDRVAKGEEIMLFCFDFLKFLESHRFSWNGSAPAETPTIPNLVSENASCTEASLDDDANTAYTFEAKEQATSFLSSDGDNGRVAPKAQGALADQSSSSPIAFKGHMRAKASHSADNSPSSCGSWHVLSSSALKVHCIDSPTRTPDRDEGITSDVSSPTSSVAPSPRLSHDRVENDDPLECAGALLLDDDDDDDAGDDVGIVSTDGRRPGNQLSARAPERGMYTTGTAASRVSPVADSHDDTDDSDDSARLASVSPPIVSGKRAAGITCRKPSCPCDARDCCDTCRTLSESSDSDVSTRAMRLRRLRKLFLPMYERCKQASNDGDRWTWMPRLFPGAA